MDNLSEWTTKVAQSTATRNFGYPTLRTGPSSEVSPGQVLDRRFGIGDATDCLTSGVADGVLSREWTTKVARSSATRNFGYQRSEQDRARRYLPAM